MGCSNEFCPRLSENFKAQTEPSFRIIVQFLGLFCGKAVQKARRIEQLINSGCLQDVFDLCYVYIGVANSSWECSQIEQR